MSKIRVLSDQLANQIAAGEVVERPASVAKELVENAIDSGALRIQVDVEGGGRRLLRVVDDGEGMSRDDAVLAFERHATSKISEAADLNAIGTLGFRGEALASIAAVARVDLVTMAATATTATRVVIEAGRMSDVKDAAHPPGTSLTVRDLFFNVPARRKFLRSEATESFHLTNLVTHYALANPSIAFTLSNNGRETLRVATARDLRERVYQIFGADFLANLLEVTGSASTIAKTTGFVSSPRERRSSRDAQYLFINGRYVRDRVISRSISEAYRTVLPNGVYPAAILFLDVPLEEVDVNVHPAKTEVRFRRAVAVGEAVRDAVRSALVSAGYVRQTIDSPDSDKPTPVADRFVGIGPGSVTALNDAQAASSDISSYPSHEHHGIPSEALRTFPVEPQERIEFAPQQVTLKTSSSREPGPELDVESRPDLQRVATEGRSTLPSLTSAANLVREVPVESLSRNIQVLGQLEDSYIVANDEEGLLLIGQHPAHERILYDKYHALEGNRRGESQNLLIPETFDLSPAQVIALDVAEVELERYGFGLMRLSGRTIAIKAVPVDLPMGEARNLLAEILSGIDTEKLGTAREALRHDIATSLACHAAVKAGTSLAPEKMRWLIESLLNTSAPTTCPHGRPVVLRLTVRDIEKGFLRS